MDEKYRKIVLPEKIERKILEQILLDYPEESCGLLGGTQNIIKVYRGVENILHSSVAYRMDAQQQLKVLSAFEERNLELIGIYHSHPVGKAYPSERDIEEFLYPGIISLIIVPLPVVEIKAFKIEDHHVLPIDLIRNQS